MLFLCHEAPQFFRNCPLPPSLSGRVRSRTWIYGVVMFRSVTSQEFICMNRHGRVVTKVTTNDFHILKYFRIFVYFIARAYARAVLGVVILSVRPSVCLSVTRVYRDKTKCRTADILIPHETAITLLLCYQEWLVGDAPFPLKPAFKVTHPFEKRRLRPFSAHNVSTVGDSEKVQLRRI